MAGCTFPDASNGNDIPVVEDDGGDAGSGDTARASTDTATRGDVATVESGDAVGPDAKSGDTSTSPDTKPADALGDTVVDRCMGVATAPFEPPTTCAGPSGYTAKEIPANHVYASSWFGCYRKADGTIYKDPTDNCLFACGNKGLCAATLSGPECEATLKWFAADADRFGCGGRIRVTNCANARSVILVTLDRGPNCKTVEQAYGAPAVDMSYPAMTYLFEGKTYGVTDKKRILVEAVADTTPLGPE